jgi:cobalt-zinc-cadmium efflux system protein
MASGHDPHDHGSASASVMRANADQRYLAIGLGIIVGFMVAEIVVAIVSGSLALLADAGHMLTDAGAIGGAIWASRLAQRPETASWTFGLKRAEILAAATNGMALLVVGVTVLLEAIRRLVHPPSVAGLPILVVALLGVVVNVAATWVLSKADRGSLNVEAAFQHILTDLYAFVGTAVAGVLVLTVGWQRADAVASLVVVGLVLRASWRLLRAAFHVLLEGTPETVDLEEVRRHLHELPEVVAVHDLHAWTLTSALPVLSAHVVVTDDCLCDGSAASVLDHLQACLSSHFDVEHSTFQLEPATHAEHETGAHG